MSASNSAKHRMDRIIRLHEEIDQIKKDIRDIYAEEKAEGGDKTAMGEAITKIRKREKDKDGFDERENMVDVYLMAYNAPSGTAVATHTHAPVDHKARAALRTSEAMDDNKAFSAELVAAGLISEEAHHENIALSDAVARKYGAGVIDPETGEILDEPRRSDSGLNILTKHEDITAAPDTANEMDRATEGSFETGSEAAEKGREAIPAGPEGVDLNHAGAGESPATDQPLVGGDHEVTSIAEREVDIDRNPNTGEGAACALPEPDQFIEDVPPTPMKRLNYAHCFPELTKAEYGRLEFSIIGIGVSKPIIRMGDVIVDGWARYNICRALGISYPIKNYSGNDVLLDVIEWQRAARNFTPAQEKKIAADLAKEIPHRADEIMAVFGHVEHTSEEEAA